MDAKRARKKTDARRSKRETIIWAALVFVSALYAFHFFEGGRAKIITDSLAYLQLSEGEAVGVPFNTRILKPLLASLLASVTGLSTWEAFQILTPVELLLSLLLLGALLKPQPRPPPLPPEASQRTRPRTVNYIHVTLHKALKDAISDALIPRNAASVRARDPKNPKYTRSLQTRRASS